MRDGTCSPRASGYRQPSQGQYPGSIPLVCWRLPRTIPRIPASLGRPKIPPVSRVNGAIQPDCWPVPPSQAVTPAG